MVDDVRRPASARLGEQVGNTDRRVGDRRGAFIAPTAAVVVDMGVIRTSLPGAVSAVEEAARP
jgi:hypothetical protein